MDGVIASRRDMKAQDPVTLLGGAIVGMVFFAFGLGLVLPEYVTLQAMPGDLGDSRFILAALEFFYRTLVKFLNGRPADFLNAPFFYPWPLATNFSDTFWGDWHVYALARALGASELTSFQIWSVAGFALTYCATFVSFCMLGMRAWGAAAGAFLFTYALPMAAQMSHLQLAYRLWIPPALVALDWMLTKSSIRAGAACILFLGLQLAANVYLGLFLALLLACYAAAIFLVDRNRLALPSVTALRSASLAESSITLVILLAGLVVLAVVMIPYRQVQSLYGFDRPWSMVIDFLPQLGSYVLAGASRLWPDLSTWFAYPAMGEQQLFPGLTAIVPLVWFLISPPARKRHPLAAVMLATAALLFVLTIGVAGQSIYWFVYLMPGFSALRAISRIILVLMLPLAALLGMLIDDLMAPTRHRAVRSSIAGLISILLIVECSLVNFDSSSPAAWRDRVDAIEAQLPKDLPAGAVLAVRTGAWGGDPMDWILGQIDAQLVAIQHGIVTMNGYGGNVPTFWQPMSTCSDIDHNIRAGRHFLAVHDLPAADVTPKRLVLIGFTGCDQTRLGSDPTLTLGRPYHFGASQDGEAFVGDGFSTPDDTERWTDGKNAFLFFALQSAPQKGASVSIEAGSFSGEAAKRQAVTVIANGHVCGQLVLMQSVARAQVICPEGALAAGPNTLRFVISHPTRPADLGVSGDRRKLGLGLKALTIDAK